MTDSITKFFEKHPVDENAPCKLLAERQLQVFKGLGSLLELDLKRDVEVVGTHKSNGILLPVVRYNLPGGAACIVRDDFKGYDVSIIDSKPLDTAKLIDFGLDPMRRTACDCIGFAWAMVFNSFTKNPRTFTTHARSENDLWMLMVHFGTKNSMRPGFESELNPEKNTLQ